ncbi:MAG: hypothetical protein SOR61_05385 [Evtepia sp.]|uniref:hypothetical protein n=1 Tax=Evtepia sp. TaxID=2773933 RepID=UPI002A749D7E|nr:hypothetical protein [Evtepia sp.]MDY3014612.1 hypothetical protein [Evtepia sp.]
MAEFYRLPPWMLTALVMVLALCIVLQTLAISYSIRRLRTSWVRQVENGMECVILAALFLFAALLAQVQYGLFCGFLDPSAYGLARQGVFLLAAVLGTAAAVGTELLRPFFAVGGTAVLLPMTERLAGPAYPLVFLAAILFFLLRGGVLCLTRRRALHTQLSTISVKEAIDTLHTGLLFFRREGDILLCNRRMAVLAQQMTDGPLHDGREFQRRLEGGPLRRGCVREALGGQQVIRLPDASVWSIASHDIPIGRRTWVLLTADDVTERWDAVTLLAHQNQVLEKRGQELRHTIEHLQAICEAEEIARSKGRVHDLLGQRISLLLRALRDDKQPDEVLLMEFVRNLPSAFLEEQPPSPAHRLEMLKETFQGMEVSVEIRGELPEDTEVAGNFAEIAVECVTNAVRHGYATRVQFHFFQNDCWRMTVTDNGIPPAGPIREGGGIGGMRRRARRLGGTLELYTIPRFRIELSVPKEAVQK